MKKIIIAFVFMMFVNVTSSAQTKYTISNGLQLFDSLSLGTVTVTAQNPVVKKETDKLSYRVNEELRAGLDAGALALAVAREHLAVLFGDNDSNRLRLAVPLEVARMQADGRPVAAHRNVLVRHRP